MTPAEIAKLTEHAVRAKKLMEDSAKVGATAGPILDSYERTLGNFVANLQRVSKEDAGLQAAMAAMGNAAPVLEAAFQDGKTTSAKPSETAHIPAVKNGSANAA